MICNLSNRFFVLSVELENDITAFSNAIHDLLEDEAVKGLRGTFAYF